LPLKRRNFAPKSYTRCSAETNGLRGRQHESSKFAGTGHGLGNEYMLINALGGVADLQVEPISEQEAAMALPKTESQAPAIGLIGLLPLTCGVGLYLFNRRRARFA